MSTPDQQVLGIALVVVGQFNPAIFHPQWLSAEGMIRPDESKTATLNVVHPEVAEFTLAAPESGSMTMQVTRERLTATTEDARRYEVMRDLVVGVLGVLRHTPVGKLGINVEAHLPKPKDQLDKIGHRLAPKEPWAGVLEKPGLAQLAMRGARPDGLQGYIMVTVSPSARLKPGVVVAVNDHFESEPSDGSGTDRIQEILTQQWAASIKRSRHIVASLVDG